VWVEDLAVHPEHRSQGVGKALLGAAKAWARERGATHLELDSAETRTDAHRFYEREQPTLRSISFAWRL
jgi:GNAT superfamily N-acetyltransferase